MPATQTKPVFADAPAWPEGAPPAAVGSVRGHNRPPVDIEAVGEFKEAIAHLQPRIAELLSAKDRVAVTDRESAGRVGTYVAQLRAAAKAVDEKRMEVKAPYLAAGRALDTEAKAIAGPLEDAGTAANAKLNAFLREERQREEAERRRAEDARRAAEAEARAQAEAEAKERGSDEFLSDAGYAEPVAPPPPPPIRSELGNTVSARTVQRAEITDYTLAFIAVEKNEKVREAIDKAVAALVRSGQREIPGVTIHDETKAVVR